MDNHEITEDAIREKIELSPIEKYQKFNKFPWKLVIHIALLVFTTIQAVSMVELAATYQKPMLQVFKYVLMNSTDQDFSQTFYTLNDFQEHIQGLTDTLSDLESYMLNKVDKRDALYSLDVYYTNLYINSSLGMRRANQKLQEAKNSTSKMRNDRSLANNFTYIIPDIEEGILDPFDMNDIKSVKSFIQTIESMNFNIKNLYTWSQLVESQYLCYNWSITLKYEFIAMSHIITTLDAQPVYCQLANDSSTFNSHASSAHHKDVHSKLPGASKNPSTTVTYTPFGNNLNILHMTIFVLALASLIFGWLYVYEMGVLYMSTRHAKQMHKVNFSNDQDNELPSGSAWEDLSLTEKIKFFDAFLIIMMLGNVFQILGSVVAVYQNFTPTDSNAIISIKESCIGIGCMCCWFNIIKYLTFNKQFKATTNILSASTKEFLKFLVGVVPLYLAFVFLGRCLFWKYEKFESTNHAIVALFSIMAGDIVDETYTDTSAEGILSTIFLTVWIILFMSAVHNVFISIISEGFRNKLLEERYQELFNLYALGEKDTVSKWNVDQKEIMMMADMSNMNEQSKKMGDDVMALMPYIRRDSDINFDPQNREKMRKTEMERQKLKETIMEKTDEVEKILGGMKDIVNEFCSVSKDKEEKKIIKNCFIRCLRDLHSFIRTEVTKDQPKEAPTSLSRFGREAHAHIQDMDLSIDKSLDVDEGPHIRKRTGDKQFGLSFGKPSVSQPDL